MGQPTRWFGILKVNCLGLVLAHVIFQLQKTISAAHCKGFFSVLLFSNAKNINIIANVAWIAILERKPSHKQFY